jgi:predicted nucleic acid-binding protein
VLIYCDSVILIYFLDHTGPLQVRAAQRPAALWAAGDRVAVSDLTRLECRVHPLRHGDAARLAAFDGFFALADVQLVPLPRAVYDRATGIRAQHGFKTIDSLHLAAAVEAGCGRFLTNDTRLSTFSGITVKCCREDDLPRHGIEQFAAPSPRVIIDMLPLRGGTP